MTEGYREAAPLYWNHGWRGVLPLPRGQKKITIIGVSGYNGRYPSWPDVQAWSDDYPGANIALRLPNTVVGVDVDSYDGKQGGRTLAHAEQLWGPLPPTVRSTSRIDGVSGIRLYRVDPGTELETVLRFQEEGLADVEIVQYFHRYAVCWPSVHPNGRTYLWLDPDGTPTTEIPRPGTVPRLPETWVEGLRRRAQAEITTSSDVDQVIKSLPAGPMTPKVQKELADALDDLKSIGSRHDSTLRHVLKLFRYAEQGNESGIREALERLGRAFIAAVGEDRREEWDRMVRGQRGHDLIASTPSGLSLEQMVGLLPNTSEKETPRSEPLLAPTPNETPIEPKLGVRDPADALLFDDEPNRSESSPADALLFGEPDGSVGFELDGAPMDEADALLWDTTPEPATEGTGGSQTSWGPIDGSAILDGTFEPEQPTELAREDGKMLFYAGKVNALVGPPESGKSWVAMHGVAQALAEDGGSMYLDFEDSPKAIYGRFLDLGAARDALRCRFGYIQPQGHPSLEEGSWEELQQAIQSFAPRIIVVDGWNAAMNVLGLKLTDNDDATTFHRILLKPLTASGAAVVAIDHVSKDSTSRGSFAIGAQAKKAMVDGAMYSVECIEQFGRGRLGKLEMWVLKDKPGAIREFAEKRKKGFYAGSVIVDARVEGDVRMRVVIESEQGGENGISKADKELMMKMFAISKYLAEEDPDKAGLSGRRIYDGVPGYQEKALRPALTELILKGNVEVRDGPRRAKIHVLQRPYTGPENSASDDPDGLVFE